MLCRQLPRLLRQGFPLQIIRCLSEATAAAVQSTGSGEPSSAGDTAPKDAQAATPPRGQEQVSVSYSTYNTKTFGPVQVPTHVPLPSFISGERRDRAATVGLRDALLAIKASARAKFDESVDLALNLGIDPRRGDQMVRGAATLPHGTGKELRVAVFASGEAADAARAAGADVVGAEDLIERIRVGGSAALSFDKAVATPELMRSLGKVARILGPRGMMPNPKLGTVTEDVAGAVRTLKAGRVEFRADKGGVLHAGVGRASFDADALVANVGVLVSAVLALRPKGLKGSGASGYILDAHLSSTMGRGHPVTVPSLLAAAQSAKRG